MDIYCPVCGEPWDVYYIFHDMEEPWKTKFRQKQGCPSCEGVKPEHQPECAFITGELLDIMGDDLDGLAATLEDFHI